MFLRQLIIFVLFRPDNMVLRMNRSNNFVYDNFNKNFDDLSE